MIGIGIVGCGNISAAYLRLAPLFKGIEVRAVADINPAAAKARAEEYGVRALSVDDLIAARDIDIVVNLTVPAAHFGVSKAALTAGKHVYSEKPFVLTLKEGETLRALAAKKGLRVGSAPDTFLGGAHQAARAAIDDGQVGKIIAGTAHVMNHGMEHWHPNPDFFYLPGGGPMLDLGPYYVTNLIQLLGPVKRVAALANASLKNRVISSAPRKGQTVPVKTPTNIHALLEFRSGATVTLSTSWDIWQHRHANMELYGTEGSLFVPDPNWFSGRVEIAGTDGKIKELKQRKHPFGVPNFKSGDGSMMANYRTAGLAEMADAIAKKRPHRCSLELALHAVEVMTATLKSGKSHEFVTMTTTCDRPAALSAAEARKLMK